MTTGGDARPGAPQAHDDGDAPPPPGGSWRRLYAAVLLWLVLQIGLYYLFTRAFS